MFGFFRSKRAFEEAVQKEVDKREAERKQKNGKSWEKWLEENPIEIKFSKENELRILYTDAEKQYKDGNYLKAMEILNGVISGFTELGEMAGLYVFILAIDIQKATGNFDDTVVMYDRGINYYKEFESECAERWIEHLEVAKESYIKEVEAIETMQNRYNISVDMELLQALQRIESLAVYRFLDISTMQNSFDNVWLSVLKEVELFESEDSGKNLNKTTYKGAKNWLKKFAYLCSGAIPDEYKE